MLGLTGKYLKLPPTVASTDWSRMGQALGQPMLAFKKPPEDDFSRREFNSTRESICDRVAHIGAAQGHVALSARAEYSAQFFQPTRLWRSG